VQMAIALPRAIAPNRWLLWIFHRPAFVRRFIFFGKFSGTGKLDSISPTQTDC
jgi:hypothetical protein